MIWELPENFVTMPSIIAIDNSLSMSKAVATDDDGSIISKLQLACLCSKNIIDKFGKSKLEHVSLVSFSSNVNVICDFTRNYDELKSNLSKVWCFIIAVEVFLVNGCCCYVSWLQG